MIKIILLPILALLVGMSNAQAGTVVIGHPSLGKLDAETVQKIYTGKMFEVGGIHITAINIESGSLRVDFLKTFLHQSDEKYTAYWAMRRFVGKGVPPREASSSAEVIQFVQSTPGAIGYVEESDVIPEVTVIAR